MQKPILAAAVVAALVVPCVAAHAQARITVSATPIADIRGSTPSGDIVFESVAGATRLSDGTIVVGDGTGAAIRFLDARGRLVRTVGRQGSGPGEFRVISWLAQCGPDRVYAFDQRQGRLTVVSASGEVVRETRLPAEPRAAPPPQLLACSRDGGLAMLGRRGGDRVPVESSMPNVQLLRARGPLSIVDSAGAIIHAVPDVPLGDFVVMGDAGGAPRPLAPTTSLAMTADRIWVGMGDSATVRSYARDGRPMPSVRTGLTARRATQADFDRALEQMLAFVPARASERARAILASVKPPAELPVYSAVHADPAGVLWVVHSPPGAPAVQLRALGVDGRVLGDATLRLPLQVLEVGAEHLLGAYVDDDGETHVVVYGITRR